MKKITYIVTTIILIISLATSCKGNKQLEKQNEEIVEEELKIPEENNSVEIKKWKYGFALDKEGKPIYYDPIINENSEFVITYFTMTDEEVEKYNSDIVHCYSLRIYDDEIVVIDTFRNKLGVAVNGPDLRLKHRIKNNRNYVSKDGRNWEVLEIKYFKETNEKMVYTQTNVKNDVYTEPLILVYFKCSYFEGEYYITSRL